MADERTRPTPTERETALGGRDRDKQLKAAIVLLAAGGSERLGQPKQLLPYKGTTLLAHATATAIASRVGPVVVVLGHEAATLKAILKDFDVQIAVNEDWRNGMATSLRAGLATIERLWPGTGSLLVMTCDQPLVPPKVIRELAEAVVNGPKRIAACGYGGAVGVPAAFARRFFPDLLKLEGDQGARALLLKRMEDVEVVPCPEAASDIDTAADLTELGGDPAPA